MADAVFRNLIKEKGVEGEWAVDSAALGSWHVGNQPDERCQGVLKAKGIKYQHAVRQVG
jgi:protein-tyrosine-phosphatase